MDAKLDPRVSLELTDRQCAKIIGSLLGGLATMAPASTIYSALDFHYRHRDQLEALYDATFAEAVKDNEVERIPKPETG